MKNIKEITEEIQEEWFSLRDLDNYMVAAGYHSNLPDADLKAIAEDESIIYLGKEKPAKVYLRLLITRRSIFPDAFRVIVRNVVGIND